MHIGTQGHSDWIIWISESFTGDSLWPNHLNQWVIHWRLALTKSFESVSHSLETRSDQIIWISESFTGDSLWPNHLNQWVIHWRLALTKSFESVSHSLETRSDQIIWISELLTWEQLQSDQSKSQMNRSVQFANWFNRFIKKNPLVQELDTAIASSRLSQFLQFKVTRNDVFLRNAVM